MFASFRQAAVSSAAKVTMSIAFCSICDSKVNGCRDLGTVTEEFQSIWRKWSISTPQLGMIA
jgi:hypothetical protein